MPLNDTGYFIPSLTKVYTAVVDTPKPDAAQLQSPPAPWVIVGHVGDETGDGNVSLTREGGDVTTKGSMSKRAIRQLVEAVFSGFDVDLTQWTRDALTLYHGTAGGTAPTVMDIEGQADGAVTEKAALVVWNDGTNSVGLYVPRGGWTGRDNIETSSVEDAVRIPLHVGFLDSATLVGPTGNPLRFSWISPSGLLALS
jgi:hypothetical protein